MPFKIGSKVIPLDTPFTVGEGDALLRYPANWIRLASEEDKAAIGLVWEADPVRADDRFYWNGDINNPKDLDGLKATLISQVKSSAGSLLSATDWKIVRAAEGIKPADTATLAKRAEIRTWSDSTEAAILACSTVEELIAVQLSFPVETVNG